MYENEMAKAVGMMATCNCCDRIIYEDENWHKQYVETGGYCKQCHEEQEAETDFYENPPEE